MAKKYKKDRGKNLLVIIAVVVALAGMVLAYVLLSINSKPADGFADGPRNTIDDSVTIGQGFTVESLTSTGTPAGTVFEASNYTPRADGKTTVRIFIDPQCPVCGVFEATNKETIDKYISEGKIVVEYSTISFLDNASSTKYSSRAANALVCVADQSPDNYFGFMANLFESQPAENTSGLSNGEIYALAQDAGVAESDTMETCIVSKQFDSWVTEATKRALSGPIVKTNNGEITGTPSVFLNGEKISVDPSNAEAFKAALDTAIEATSSNPVE